MTLPSNKQLTGITVETLSELMLSDYVQVDKHIKTHRSDYFSIIIKPADHSTVFRSTYKSVCVCVGAGKCDVNFGLSSAL